MANVDVRQKVAPSSVPKYSSSNILAALDRLMQDNTRVLVQEMSSELMKIRNNLKYADARQSKQERIRHWVRETKALAYRIEDVIDTFNIRIESRNEISVNGSCVKRLVKRIKNCSTLVKKRLYARQVRLEIEDIKNKKAILEQTKETYGITDYYPEREQALSMLGRDVDLLVLKIFDQNTYYPIICISGAAERGRSLLVRQLCNDERIQQHFQAIAWVHGPPESSTRFTFQRTTSAQVSNSDGPSILSGDMEEEELIEKLRDFQQRHRCLIVLDNIPTLDAWKMMWRAFTSGTSGIRILITTESPEVAGVAITLKGFVHQMWSPTEEDAWKLFSRYVTEADGPELNVVDYDMENIGTRPDPQVPAVEERLEIGTSQQGEIVHENNEIPSESKENGQQALTSTYNDLPYQLKSCLFYLATSPKGTKIKAEKLYHLWMAEADNDRFVSMIHLEETLDKLHLRRMVYVQEEEVMTVRRVKYCFLDDWTRDFCVFMGRQEEFFVEMKNELEQDSDPSSWTDRTWRLVIYVGQHDNGKLLNRLNKRLRCLLVRNAWENQELDTRFMLADIIKCILQSKYLRILDFDGVDFKSETLPKGISELVHLRYLSFMGCVLKTLPASICRLSYLQILDLRVRSGCEIKVPNVLHKLRRLRHLYLPLTYRTPGGDRLRLDGLTQLETLENFNTEVCNVKDLSTLTKVGYLTVNIEGRVEDLKGFIEHMNKPSEHEVHSSLDVRNFDCYTEEKHAVFRELLICPGLDVLYVEGYLGRIPLYGKISEKLTKLVFSGSKLEIDPMPTLGKLPNLRVLILHDDAFIGKEITCSSSNFQELRRLELLNLHELEIWTVENRAMPKLSFLKIENCCQLKNLANGLGFFENLQELKILGMPETFKRRLCEVAGERGADMDKVPRHTLILFE